LNKAPVQGTDSPRILARSEHEISRANISENALKVLYRLKSAGYEAYLVGGGVRDLMLGREPKDFDVATDAHPEEVAKLFRNSRLIGRRFRLVHVHFGREIIEVATFRGDHQEDEANGNGDNGDGMIVSDNVYGTLEQDAWRRDFSINSLYYNIRDFSVVDYTGGIEDLKSGILRIIGDAEQRYSEDPVRMLRAVRFAAKLGFRIHPDSEAPLFEEGERLDVVPPARLFDEVNKLFLAGAGLQTFELLRHYRLFEHLFPVTETSLAMEKEGYPEQMVIRGLDNTDARVAEGKPVTPAFLYAVLLWGAVHDKATRYQNEGMSEAQALQLAGDEVVAKQAQTVAIPKRFSLQSREIWTLQAWLKRRFGRRAYRLLDSPRFRAGYDFLLLRIESGEDEYAELGEWWTDFQEADEEARSAMIKSLQPNGSGRRRRRRRGGRRKTDNS
jgi:poly(A) polymerase